MSWGGIAVDNLRWMSLTSVGGSGLGKKRTLRSEIQSARAFAYTLEPARLHALETALTLDEIVPAHVNRTITITQSNSTAFPKEDNTDEKEKEKEKKGGEDD